MHTPLLAAAVALAAAQPDQQEVMIGGAIAVGASLVMSLLFAWAASRFLIVCPPNRLLVLSGGRHVGPDGAPVGYRIVQGGRVFRLPVVETATFMDTTTILVRVATRNAYSAGGIPLDVDAVAAVRLSDQEHVVVNAVERFLGRDRQELRRAAAETLEGALRGAIAGMTPEEVVGDPLKVGAVVLHGAGADFEKLGLAVDAFSIQRVADDQGYLQGLSRRTGGEADTPTSDGSSGSRP